MTRVRGLGDVPSSWAIHRARFLLTRARRPIRDFDGVVTAFRDGQVTLRSNRRLEGFTEADKEIGYQGIRSGDLVVHAMDGFAGAIGISDSDGKASPVVHAYRTTAMDPRYVAYVLRTMAASKWIQALAKGIRERSTSFDASTLGDLALPVPPLDEQRRIADFLDTETARLDALIRTRLRYEQILAERHASELTRLLDSGANQPSALGRHLVRSPSYGVLKPSYTETGPRIIRILNVREDGSVDATALEHIDPLQHLEYRRTVLTEGDVCLGVVGTIGRPFVVTRDLAGANVSRAIARLRPRTDLHPVILQAWLRTARFNSWAEQTTNATAQRVLNMGDLAKYLVWLPEAAVDVALEVGRIDDWHRGISGQIRLQAARLAERRQALIAAAVTGQLDVTTARGGRS